MSSDDAIFIQQDISGAWVAQYGSMSADAPPNPELVPFNKTFNTIEEAIVANIENAYNTEYGFQFPTLATEGYSITRHHSTTEPLFELEGAR